MDLLVTVPMAFQYRGLKGLAAWIAEGDPAGSEWSGVEWSFYLGSRRPRIEPNERVYIVYGGKLRGYAPLVRVEHIPGYDSGEDNLYFGKAPDRYALVRHGDAVAVTIGQEIKGFRGFRYRFWEREDERPFPDWRTA